MRPKLIASDLDGTLMGETRIISSHTRRALQQAMEQGCLVAIATGRGFRSAVRYARELRLNAPMICYQGALIRDHRDEATIYSATMPLDLAQEVIAFSRSRRLNAQVYLEDDRAYADRVDPIILRAVDLTEVEVIDVGDLAGWLDRPPLKFLFFVEQKEDAPGLVRDLESRFNGRLQVVRSWHQIVEVTGPLVSKGEALERLAACLGVPQSATIAIGDQDNDVSMIAWAGLGIAMGDASPAAQAAADVTVPSLQEEGAAWAIEYYVLGG